MRKPAKAMLITTFSTQYYVMSIDEPLMEVLLYSKIDQLIGWKYQLKDSCCTYETYRTQNALCTESEREIHGKWEVQKEERSEAPSIEFQDVSGERHSQLTACLH